MSKKLTASEALEKIKESPHRVFLENDEYKYVGDIYENELDIIDTALKDYKKKTKLAKEYEDVNNVAKRLKALEIIKPLVYIFWNNGDYGEIRLTESGRIIKEYIPKNEYELLKQAGFKEVLL